MTHCGGGLPLFLLLLVLQPTHSNPGGGGVCTTPSDCWLNGDCVMNTCVCDKAWTGSYCNILQQQPSYPIWPPPDPLPSNLSTLPSSWGSSIVVDDQGVYHAYIEAVCRFFTWMHIAGSVVVHATSPTLLGPYTFSDLALPQQSMTPHIIRDADGAWLLLHQRNTSVKGDPQCTGDYLGAVAAFHPGSSASLLSSSASATHEGTPPNATEFDGPPAIARSLSLYGPWTTLDLTIVPPPGRTITNPNPSLLPLSPPGRGYLLAFTSQPSTPPYSEAVALAFAQDWRSGVFEYLPGTLPPQNTLDCEDPHLFTTPRGYHIVCHRRRIPTNPWNFTDCGGYGVSLDGLNWSWSPTPIYTTTLPWAPLGGGAPFTFGRRERPEVLLGKDGFPAYLLTGVETVTGSLGKPSLSVVTPLGPSPPPSPPSPPSPPTRYFYSVEVSDKSPTPIISQGNPPGGGYSPCNLTFNPAILQAHPPGLNSSIALLRVSGCPPEYGGTADHLLYAPCDSDTGVCGDVQPLAFNFEPLAEDPRVFFNEEDSKWYLFYYASGTNQSTVFLRRSPTPLDPTSWELVASALPWHRNGCAFRASNGTLYVIYGETYNGAYPGKYLPGLGLAQAHADWATFTTVTPTLLNAVPSGPEPEVCLEAATPPVLLSTGDWLHLYAAGTPGWGPWGPGEGGGSYVAGWVVLSGKDPSVVVERGVTHPFVPTLDFEVGTNPRYPVFRNNTLFVTSLVPAPGLGVDVFRAFYGAADANVATAIVRVTTVPAEGG